MCFETTKRARARIAKEDIKCWKSVNILNEEVSSACEHYTYIPGVIQPIEQLIKIEEFGDYHIKRGYHSCRTLKEAKSWGTFMTVRIFIIPKGTLYYSNKTEYVSETIILQ